MAGTSWREGGKRHHGGGEIAGILEKPQESVLDETVVGVATFPREGAKEGKEGELHLVTIGENVGFPRERVCVEDGVDECESFPRGDG